MTDSNGTHADDVPESLTNHGVHLRQAQAVANLGSWELDLTDNTLYWSEEVTQIFAVPDEQTLTYDRFLEYVHPEDRAFVEAEWQAALDGEEYDIEHRIVTGDGDTRWVRERADVEFDKTGTPTTAIGVVQDITERKEREQEREATRKRYRTLLQAAPDPVFVADADTGEIIEANTAAATLRDQPIDEIIRLHQSDLHPTADAEAYRRLFERAVGDSGIYHQLADGRPIYAVTVHGERVQVEISVETIELADRIVIYGNFRDITERTERERDLRRFKQAIEAAAHSIYITDRDGTIEYVNPAFEATTGYTADEAIGRTPRILKSGAHDAEFYEELWVTILNGDMWDGEVINTTRDGERYIVNQTIAPVLNENGEITHFVAVNADITELREQQDELHKHQQAIDNAQTPLILTDPTRENNPIVYLNDAFTDLTGYTEDELLGENCRLLQGEQTDPETVAAIQTAIDNENPITVEIRNYRKDGSLFWNELTVTPIYDTDGTLIHYLGTQRDITERKERKQHLRVVDRVLRHNLRNDMGVIRGRADTIQKTASGSIANQAETIIRKSDELLDTAEKQRAITNLLLEQPTYDRIELGELIEQVTSAVAEDYPAATIDVDCPNDVTATASSHIDQAIRELVTNAVQHNDQDAPAVRITVSQDSEYNQIQIADNGPRIPEKDRQVGAGRQNVEPLYHGRGLGLWLVCWIVTRSNGTIAFDENDSRGNKIVIELPRQQAASN